MTKENLNVLSKEIKGKSCDVCPLYANNSSHPFSKVRNKPVEKDTVYQMDDTTVHIKEERVDTKV